jgi:hypothetical protein
MTVVDLTWPPDTIREFCESNDNWMLYIPETWTASEVEALYRRQLGVEQPYVGVISEIAADARASAETLTDIWTRFGEAVEVASALATNPATPTSLRKRLADHPEEVVREHAKAKIQRLPGNVYAILRIDDFHDASVSIENRISVTAVVRDLATAESEVRRLNHLKADKQCRYFWQATRMKERMPQGNPSRST